MIHEFDNPNFNEFKNELIEYSYSERKKDPIGVKVSNRNGWQSKPFKVTDKNNTLHSFLIDSISCNRTGMETLLKLSFIAILFLLRSFEFSFTFKDNGG